MIIGICGYKRSGKTTAADYLVSEHGFTKVNFKDALIEEVVDKFPDLLKMFKSEYDMDYDKLFRVKPPMVRALMQNYGTQVRRQDNEYYWVLKWKERLARLDKPLKVVVDDVRFVNEADAIKLMGGVVVRVERSGWNEDDNHISEREHLEIDEDFTITAGDNQHKIIYNSIDKILTDVSAD